MTARKKMPSKSNDRLFWADRKNRMEKSRLDMVIRRYNREKISLTHEIEREKRVLVKSFRVVKRTTGVSDQGVPPDNEDDVEFMNAPNYKMGIRLSEHRLLEWRGSEKQLEKARAHAEYELLKSAGIYRRYSAAGGTANTHMKSRATRSAPSIGIEFRQMSRNADDEVFYNGDGYNVSSPRMVGFESVVNVDADYLEKQIVQGYKSLFHNTQIPPTSLFTKSTKYRHTKSESDLKDKPANLRPHTSIGMNHSYRKSRTNDDDRRPSTAQNYQKIVKDRSEKKSETKPQSVERRDRKTPNEPLMNNFMCESEVPNFTTGSDVVNGKGDSVTKTYNHNISVSCKQNNDQNQNEADENEKQRGSETTKSLLLLVSEEQDIDQQDAGPTQKVYNNDQNTIINSCKENMQTQKTQDAQGPEVSNPEQNQNPAPASSVVGTNISTNDKRNVKPSTEREINNSTASTNSSDIVDGNVRKMSSPRTKPRRVSGLGGIMEDKMLQFENQTGGRFTGDDAASQTTMNTTSRLSSSKQRRTSVTSNASSDRYSYLFGSMSDVSIGSDGQRRPSNWREIVKAEATPIPENTKFVSVTNVVRAALAFSKTARKRALEKLVEEQSADPRELIRQERLRRLESRNNVLMSIADQWSVRDEGKTERQLSMISNQEE